jgi:hypothetical protein
MLVASVASKYSGKIVQMLIRTGRFSAPPALTIPPPGEP